MTENIPKPMIEIESVANLIETYVNEAINNKLDEMIRQFRSGVRKFFIALLVGGWTAGVSVLARMF